MHFPRSKRRKLSKFLKTKKSSARLKYGSGYKGLALTICGGDTNLARAWFGI